MSEKETVEHLKERLAELVEHRVALAYRVHSATHEEGLQKLVLVHQAIEAMEAVIASGAGEPPSPFDDPNYSPISFV